MRLLPRLQKLKPLLMRLRPPARLKMRLPLLGQLLQRPKPLLRRRLQRILIKMVGTNR
ncbi:hypothetical protein [Pseudoxanthomonas japonensis]|uniref:hypothetical protein n=1 Tax=Pseudoxanthomonas japonensis TaxID=69284 RepID=UPI00374A3792